MDLCKGDGAGSAYVATPNDIAIVDYLTRRDLSRGNEAWNVNMAAPPLIAHLNRHVIRVRLYLIRGAYGTNIEGLRILYSRNPIDDIGKRKKAIGASRLDCCDNVGLPGQYCRRCNANPDADCYEPH